MKTKEEIIDEILEIEGGYVNYQDDFGGETNFGITVATARRFGYTCQMKDLTREKAFEIYEKLYWDSLSLDEVVETSEQVAYKLFDI